MVVHAVAWVLCRDLCGDGGGIFFASACTANSGDRDWPGAFFGCVARTTARDSHVGEVLEFASGNPAGSPIDHERHLPIRATSRVPGDYARNHIGAACGERVLQSGPCRAGICADPVAALEPRRKRDDRKIRRALRGISPTSAGVCAAILGNEGEQAGMSTEPRMSPP